MKNEKYKKKKENTTQNKQKKKVCYLPRPLKTTPTKRTKYKTIKRTKEKIQVALITT